MINYKKFVENSRKWLYQYIQNNHLQSLCIGISGGIDSCISACLANPVCKELNIPLIGRSLPTTTNKIEESKVAQLVGEAFCNNFITVNISEECQKLINELELIEGEMTRLQEGNIKARVRMIYLRHLASVHKGVVLDNDNFTEWNLGFWTIGGDSPGDCNLGLHYLWKTEIYELAKYLLLCYDDGVDEEKFQALRESIHLIPTDGNGVSNSDCEQFGLDNYEQVDDVLKTIYYSTHTKEDYIRLIDSYNEQGVDKVMMLHQNTEYKRKELPIKPTKEELGL
jgi:NAD+ synthetase